MVMLTVAMYKPGPVLTLAVLTMAVLTVVVFTEADNYLGLF